MKKICHCKAVKVETVKETIRDGIKTLEGIQIKTGASCGACKGRRCKKDIYELLETYKKGEWV